MNERQTQTTVTVAMTCSRTGYSASKQIPANEAVDFLQSLQVRMQKTREYEESVGQLTADDSTPDLIVSYKGKAVALAIVSSKCDSAVQRLLADLTRREDVFPAPVVKPRKKQTVIEE